MIHNRNMSSEEFVILQNYVVVKPVELERGELTTETGLILAQEQNNSIIHRPSTGTIIITAPDVKLLEVGMEVLWVEQEGLDIELSDGDFVLLKDTSILGYKNV